MSSELNPCPFCGGKAYSRREPGHQWVVSCNNAGCDMVCRVSVPVLDMEGYGDGDFTASGKAESKWNTRYTERESGGE